MKYSATLTALAVLIFAGCQGKSAVPPAATVSSETIEQGPDGNATAEATEVAFNTGGLPTVEISVPAMMCPLGCAPKVKEVLAKETGVKEVKVDFESKTAVVAIEPAQFDAEHAIHSLADYQFDGSTVKGTPAATVQ